MSRISSIKVRIDILILTLSILYLIGIAMVADGLGRQGPKAWISFTMGYLVFMEFIHLHGREKIHPVQLRIHYQKGEIDNTSE